MRDAYVDARNSLIDGVNGYIKEKQLGRFLPPIISRTLDQFIEKLDRNIDPQNRTVEARFLTYIPTGEIIYSKWTGHKASYEATTSSGRKIVFREDYGVFMGTLSIDSLVTIIDRLSAIEQRLPSIRTTINDNIICTFLTGQCNGEEGARNYLLSLAQERWITPFEPKKSLTRRSISKIS